MKPKKLLVFLMALLMVVTMAVPALAAALGENTGSQTGESYFDPATAITTLAPTATTKGTVTADGSWTFAYPVVIWKITYTLAADATTSAGELFEGHIGNGIWKTIGAVDASNTPIVSTSTYSYTEIRYTGDPSDLTDVSFVGQYLRGVTGDMVEIVKDNIVSLPGRTFVGSNIAANAFDHDRSTLMQMNNNNSSTTTFTESWVSVELERPTLITEIVVYHNPNKAGYLWFNNVKFQFSNDGENWQSADCTSWESHAGGIGNANIITSTRVVTYTESEWTTYQTQIKADPLYVKDAASGTGRSVTYLTNWYDNSGYVLSFQFGHQYTMPYKYMRVYSSNYWTLSAYDINVYGVAYDGDNGITTKQEWSDSRMAPPVVETLIPIQEKDLVWEMDSATQITNIAYAGTASLAGGKWYGAADVATDWYELGSITDTATSGNVTVTKTIGFKYVKFVGDTDALTASSVAFTGRKLSVRGEFIEYAKDADGNPAVISLGNPDTNTKNENRIPNVLKHDTSLKPPYLTGTTTNSVWPVYIGGELERPMAITEIVVYHDLAAAARLAGASSSYIEASLDGIQWERLPVTNVTDIGHLDEGQTLMSKDTTNQGYVYQINTKSGSTASREWRYVRIYRENKSWGFSFVAMDVYGVTYGTMSSNELLAEGNGIIAPSAVSTQGATLYDAHQVTVDFGKPYMLNEISSVVAGPNLKIEGSTDGENWFYLNIRAANQYNRGKLTVYGTQPVRYLRCTSNLGLNTASLTSSIKGYDPGVTGNRLSVSTSTIEVTGAYAQTAAITSHNLLRSFNHDRTTYHTGSAGNPAYLYAMLESPAKLTEVMLWPNSNFPTRMHDVIIQAATAEDPNTWDTLYTINLYDDAETTYNSAIYGPKGSGTGYQQTGVKYTIDSDKVYSYIRFYKDSTDIGTPSADSAGGLCIAAFEFFGTPAETGNPLNGDDTASVWFVIAPISLALCGTTALVIHKNKKKKSI